MYGIPGQKNTLIVAFIPKNAVAVWLEMGTIDDKAMIFPMKVKLIFIQIRTNTWDSMVMK